MLNSRIVNLARLSTSSSRLFSSCAASRISFRPAAAAAAISRSSSSSSASLLSQCRKMTTRGRTKAMSMRSLSTTCLRQHKAPTQGGNKNLHVTFIDKEGHEHRIAVSEGENLLDIALANDLEMEGACGGSCACSTCHVIVTDEALYDSMGEPEDDENDMLDLAFGLTATSRLGCQIRMTKDLDGLVVKLPTMTRNMQASDFR